MPDALPPFPVDDVALNMLEHAMGARRTVSRDGETELVGADYTLPQLLKFLAGLNKSGYDPDKEVPYEGEDLHTHDDIVDGTGYFTYTRDSVIRELIAEVRRQRAEIRQLKGASDDIG